MHEVSSAGRGVETSDSAVRSADGSEVESRDGVVGRAHLVLTARRRWGYRDIVELWRFRTLFGRLALRDITLRYRQTALGLVWVVLQPLIAAGIFAFVFGRVAGLSSNGVPYVVFSYAGLVCWTTFSTLVTKQTASLVGNAQLVSKIYFPRMLLPLSLVVGALLDFTVSLVLMAVLLIATGTTPGATLALLPVWLILTLALATGFGLMASSLAVRFRDVNYILPVLIQFLLYASPVAYSLSVVPHSLRAYFLINPLTGLLEAFRWSLLGRGHLQWSYTVYSAVFTVVMLVVGGLVFLRMERRFADVI